jgi:hypothetical protein
MLQGIVIAVITAIVGPILVVLLQHYLRSPKRRPIEESGGEEARPRERSESVTYCGKIIEFRPQSGVVSCEIPSAEFSARHISLGYVTPEEGRDYFVNVRGSYDGCQYRGKYGYENCRGYRSIDDPHCTFSLKRIDSKIDLKKLMRQKGTHDPNVELPSALEYVDKSPDSSIFLFGEYCDSWPSKPPVSGSWAVILISNN